MGGVVLGLVLYLSVVVLQRGKKVPEGLTPAEDISKFEQLASHPVSCVMHAN